MSRHVPLFYSRLLSLILALAGGIVGVYSAFHAKHESTVTKQGAQSAVNTLGLGVSLNIITNDVYTSGEVEGVSQLGIALLSGFIIFLLLIDSKKRRAVPNAPNVRVPPFSSRTLVLQFLCLTVASLFSLVAVAITTHIVFTRSANTVSTFPNGTTVPSVLANKLAAQLGITPVYKEHGYLVFLAAAGWPGFFFCFVSTIITFVAWRRFQIAQKEMSDSQCGSTEKF